MDKTEAAGRIAAAFVARVVVDDLVHEPREDNTSVGMPWEWFIEGGWLHVEVRSLVEVVLVALEQDPLPTSEQTEIAVDVLAAVIEQADAIPSGTVDAGRNTGNLVYPALNAAGY